MECLVYADGDDERGEELVSVLRGSGVHTTRPVERDEFFDLLAKHPWGCLVLAADGATGDILDIVSQCRRAFPEIPPLVLVKGGDIDTTVRVMKAGAADCMETPVETGRLLSAVTTLCRRAARESGGSREQLTRAERTVLGYILEGRTNKEIAEMLCRSPRTVEVHRRHIMRKLGATNLVDLVKHMMLAGDTFLPGDDRKMSVDSTVPDNAEIGPEGKQESR